MSDPLAPFAAFAPPLHAPSVLRRNITAACRRPEPECVAALMSAISITPAQNAAIAQMARGLVEALRAKGQRGGVEGLIQEYALSSQEGVALMCLAEALLRIPDSATRDALIRDKISDGDWQAHLGDGRSLFVNAATWGLVVTGKLVGDGATSGLGTALSRVIARLGEPVIRRGVDLAMELMGEQFVIGETIGGALRRARQQEQQGFTYSYDMLGEAATTAADAARYLADYERAIHAIGKASDGRGVYAGPGISIKLSALHPRYARSQAGRVMAELLPHLRGLALLCRQYDMGLNIDAEEADRLELSLDLLEALALDPDLAGWNGLGFVVQAYGKRCPCVIDWLADLAQRAGRRIMVRLVKGAYWDSEIKRAQVDGLSDFPVFTRKVYTDVSYLVCAQKLLARRDVLFPQFATHNAQTLAAVYALAGPDFTPHDYEFQCLHGMGEPLYEEVVGAGKLNRPCRIYAPVGTHETLLAYLVRRLLENGANSSFVHRTWDDRVSVDDLVRSPLAEAGAIKPPGAPHPAIALPRDILAPRLAARGIDLADESVLAGLSQTLQASVADAWRAGPMVPGLDVEREYHPVRNPAHHGDVVGHVAFARERDAVFAMRKAALASADWAAVPVAERSGILERAADLMEQGMERLLGLIMREAGKSAANAVAEVREAVDFLRYYAAEARRTLTPDIHPLGVAVCISPWNFPLSIFTGQVAAALVTGNVVLAKPAEETPLIAAQCVRILHEAGVPLSALQFVPGDGAIGAALVAAPEVGAVLFTGSTGVARLIRAELASHLSPQGAPIPLVAETGGQNAMVVDSSALAEQVVADVIASAFDSAGQRCSALRVLCLQEDIAQRQLAMLRGALAELAVGPTDRLSTDMGPVITAEAQGQLTAHIELMRALGCRIEQRPLPEACRTGTFVPPTLIEIDDIAQIGGEVFGPVLHVLRWRRDELDRVIDAVNATGYGLTFGLHTRLDDMVDHVTARVRAGNVYINRNMIGAVVGVQPFGGRGLSGTGPKAGGPLYLGRLVQARPETGIAGPRDTTLEAFAGWLEGVGQEERAQQARRAAQSSPHYYRADLAGPVGEANRYALHPRGRVLLVPATVEGLLDQLIAALGTGNHCVVVWPDGAPALLQTMPDSIAQRVTWAAALPEVQSCAAVLIEPRADGVASLLQHLAALPGPIPLVQMADAGGQYRPDWLVEEVSMATNTTAAGGNASLMALV